MSYTGGNHGADLRNRQNILQDLQQQKQQLLQGGSTPMPPATFSSNNMASHQLLGRPPPVKHDMSMNRRSALEYASTHSSGYFLASDSTAGNPILPVIPRVDDS